jgi:hypothetical protein
MSGRDWLEAIAKRRREAPKGFSPSLDAIRLLSEAAIHSDWDQFMAMEDALDVIRDYVYDRATDEEMHERSQQTRLALAKYLRPT